MQLPSLFTRCMTAVVQQNLCCLQDPTRRPTAQGLLQHDFLQHVQAPASLQHTISAHAAKRPPLDQLNHQATEYQQTMPRWNFGTEQAPPGAQPQAKKAGTLRSHQINMTFRDDGTVRHHTVAKHPSLAMMAQLAEAGLVSSKAALHSTSLLLSAFWPCYCGLTISKSCACLTLWIMSVNASGALLILFVLRPLHVHE